MKEQQPITKVIRTRTERTNEMEHSSPMFLTSSFTFDDAESMRAAFADETDDNIYSRFSNPTVKNLPTGYVRWKVLKQRMQRLRA